MPAARDNPGPPSSISAHHHSQQSAQPCTYSAFPASTTTLPPPCCDGELIAAAEEERFSRLKHDSGFPRHAIDYCLRTADITAQDLDYVVFYEKPLPKFERILHSTLAGVPARRGSSKRRWPPGSAKSCG
ncbi:MAG: carbamoyltransferase N-terminal domain-containing protein [Caldilineaceae bacterium]